MLVEEMEAVIWCNKTSDGESDAVVASLVVLYDRLGNVGWAAMTGPTCLSCERGGQILSHELEGSAVLGARRRRRKVGRGAEAEHVDLVKSGEEGRLVL